MAATVIIYEKNTVGEADTDKTSGTIRFKNADDANVDLNNPIVRPGSGSVFSYEKALRLHITASPTGSITSPRAFSDNANGFGTGVTMQAKSVGSFSTPVSTAMAAGTDFFSYTSGAPLALDVTNVGPYSAIGDIADYMYLQAEVASTASPGLTPTETLTLAFDET